MGLGTTWGDKEFEVIIGRLLRFGVILAAAWVLAGGIRYLVQYRGAKPDYRAFHGEPADLRYARNRSRSLGVECASGNPVWTVVGDRDAHRARGVFGNRFRMGGGLDVRRDYLGRAYVADLYVYQQLTR